MGGSFNPPTLAHYMLMKEAIDVLNVDIGLFVPVSDAYLRRKMRYSHPPVVLSPDLRIKMLKSICTDMRMDVCEKEIGTIEARTMMTLASLQEENPEAEIHFLMGADKMKLLNHLAEKNGFLDKYHVILYSRDGDPIEESLKESPVLSGHMDRIVILPQPAGIESISSSKVREIMLTRESSQDMLLPGVWELFKEFAPEDFPDMISKFSSEFEFLRISFNAPLVWEGLKYGNAEAAFQSSKWEDLTDRRVFCNCSGAKAASIGKERQPYPGWEDNRISIMESILCAKFEQNPALMKRLLETGNSLLVNGNSKQDTFWGVDLYSWEGENHLGKILMSIRERSNRNEVHN